MSANAFTDAIPSMADRNLSAPSPTSCQHRKSNILRESEEWEPVEKLLFVSPVKLYKGGAWTSKHCTMQIEGETLAFRKKDGKLRMALALKNIAAQVHEQTLYLRQDGVKEEIWMVNGTQESPSMFQWCTHIVKASQALAPAPAEAAEPSARQPTAYVVPLPPSYTSESKTKYEPTQKAGKLQHLCSLDLEALVSPSHREPQPTALVYASVGIEQMVQAGAPCGFWEQCRHVDHYTLGQPGSERLMHLARHLIFISRSEVVMVEKIAGLIQAHDAAHSQSKLEYTVACVPNVSVLAQKVFLAKLAEEASWIDAQMVSLPLAFVPIAADVFSMELKTGIQGGAMAGAKAELAALTAEGLYRVETLFEGFFRVQLKGDHAANILRILRTHQAEQSSFPDKGARKDPAQARLICVDRETDLVSLLCTQLSYGGIIEEIFQSQELAAAAVVEETETQLAFTMQDPVWAEVQDLNLDNARRIVTERCKDVNSRREGVKARLKDMQKTSNASVAELKRVVEQVNGFDKELPLCQAHLVLLTKIFNRTFQDNGLEMQLVQTQNMEYGLYGMNWYIENNATIKEHLHELMYRGTGVKDLARVLRLLCLATLTAGGLKGEDLDEFRTEILHTYGFGTVPLLQGLEAAKLLSGDISWRLAKGLMSSDWEKLRAQFSLVGTPEDEATCSAGYIMLVPLVYRLIPLALEGSWTQDALQRIPGAMRDESLRDVAGSKTAPDNGTVFVLFTGGCTRAEIAEVRRLAKDLGREIIILTTGVINGNDFIFSFADPDVPFYEL